MSSCVNECESTLHHSRYLVFKMPACLYTHSKFEDQQHIRTPKLVYNQFIFGHYFAKFVMRLAMSNNLHLLNYLNFSVFC